MKTYEGRITKLNLNEIFVFGSNTQGRHGKGAALMAKTLFGAIDGQAIGKQGSSYAIVTKDLTKSKHPSITRPFIIFQIELLYVYARIKHSCAFYVAYSGIGRNLNGYSNEEMAYMFSKFPIPENMVFEEEFAKLIKSQ